MSRVHRSTVHGVVPLQRPHGVRDRIGDVGDLEHVRILVNAGTERIDRVYFGGHSGGYWKNIDECHVGGGPGLLGERYSCQLSQPRYAMEDTSF
jgi:hypothetical protein